MKNAPRRGEVWLVDLGMIEKVRPALILSGPCGENDRDIITVIPHTCSCFDGFPTHACSRLTHHIWFHRLIASDVLSISSSSWEAIASSHAKCAAMYR
jgi:hypothetical protein